jgi:hypothetical protein
MLDETPPMHWRSSVAIGSIVAKSAVEMDVRAPDHRQVIMSCGPRMYASWKSDIVLD